MKKIIVLGVVVVVALCLGFTSSLLEKNYLSPGPLVVSVDGQTVYTALTTARAIAITDLSTGQTTGKIETKQNPNGILLSADGKTLWAATGEADGVLEVISLQQKKYEKEIIFYYSMRRTHSKRKHVSENIA